MHYKDAQVKTGDMRVCKGVSNAELAMVASYTLHLSHSSRLATRSVLVEHPETIDILRNRIVTTLWVVTRYDNYRIDKVESDRRELEYANIAERIIIDILLTF